MSALAYQHAEGGPWVSHTTVPTPADAHDELASWTGPHLSHGALVRVTGDDRTALYLLSDAGAYGEVPDGEALLTRWETGTAEKILRATRGVDNRRRVLCACEIARTVLHLVPPGEERPRSAIETAERYVQGKATAEEAARAAAEAEAAAWAAEAWAEAAAWVAEAAAEAAAWAAGASAWAEAAAWAGWAAARADPRGRRAHREIVQRWIPLSVLACAAVGARDPLPIPGTEVRWAVKP